jgi:hypothetical protein
MKKLYIAACTTAAVIALASCSDEVVTPDDNAGLISYDITTNNSTRASVVHSSQTHTVEFVISAALAGSNPKKYFINDEIEWFADGTADYKNGQRYWTGSPLDFFAFHNETSYSGSNSDVAPVPELELPTESNQYTHINVNDLKIKDIAGDQDDVLYAVTTNESSSTHNGVVPLNFRHALAQLNFRFQNKSRNIYVEIENFSLQGIYNQGDLMFYARTSKDGTTNGQYTEDADGNATGDISSLSEVTVCSWANLRGSDDVGLTPGAQIVALSDADVVTNDYCNLTQECNPKRLETAALTNSKSTTMLVVPQPFNTGEYRDYTNSIGQKYKRWQDARVAIRCRIYNIVDPTEFEDATKDMTAAEIHTYLNTAVNGSTNGVQIFPADAEKFSYLVVPLPQVDGASSTKGWEAGKKYVYTIIFGGEGDNARDNDNNPQLFKINLKVTTDDWDGNTASTIVM